MSDNVRRFLLLGIIIVATLLSLAMSPRDRNKGTAPTSNEWVEVGP